MKHKLILIIGCVFWTVGCTSTPANNGGSHLLNKIKQQEIKDKLQQHIDEYQSVKPSIERLVALESDLRILIAQIATFQQSPQSIPQVTSSDTATAEATDTVNPTIPDIKELDLAQTTIESEDDSAVVVQLQPDKTETVIASALPIPKVTPSQEAIQGSELHMNVPKTTVDQSQSQLLREDSGGAQQLTLNTQFGAAGVYDQCKPLGEQPNANQFGVHISSFTRQDLVVKGWNKAVQQYPQLCQKSGVIQRIQIKNTLFYSLRVGPYSEKKSAKAFCQQIRTNKQYCRVTDFTGERL